MMKVLHAMKTVPRIFAPVLLISALILLMLFVAGAFDFNRHRSVQPIEYSHKVHIGNGMTCTDCHISVESKAAASIPNTDVCQTCHSGDEPLSKSPEEVKLLRYIKDGGEIPWKQIYEVPDHVYFSHRRHVVDGELDCSTCHGNVAELTAPVSYQVVPVTMERCLDCHRQRKVTNDCLACHR